MNMKIEAASMAVQRGGVIPLDYALSMMNQGVFLDEFEDSIDGFSIEKFIDDFEYHENI